MRTVQVQPLTNSVPKMSPTINVQNQMHEWVRQMALPLVPEHKVKGAIRDVHRRTGVSFSKLRKFFYGWECAEPRASEYVQTREAFYRWMSEQEAQLTARIKEIHRLRDARASGETQFGLDV